MATTDTNMGSTPSLTTSETPADSTEFKLKFCTVCASNQNRYVGRPKYFGVGTSD